MRETSTPKANPNRKPKPVGIMTPISFNYRLLSVKTGGKTITFPRFAVGFSPKGLLADPNFLLLFVQPGATVAKTAKEEIEIEIESISYEILSVWDAGKGNDAGFITPFKHDFKKPARLCCRGFGVPTALRCDPRYALLKLFPANEVIGHLPKTDFQVSQFVL